MCSDFPILLHTNCCKATATSLFEVSPWCMPCTSHVCIAISVLTGFPVVTTPWSFTMLGCLNWPTMTASWRNLILFSSDARLFRATKIALLEESFQMPFSTFPKWPDPICSVILKKHKLSQKIFNSWEVATPYWICSLCIVMICCWYRVA